MTKQCSCKDGQKCSKCKVNLDSFHKLNPEAKPKTAEQFKLAVAPGPGLWGGLQQGTKDRIMGAGMAGLKSAVIPAAGAAMAAGLASDPGEGWGNAAKAGLAAGAAGFGAGAAHHEGMTGTSDLHHSYQRGVGGDIRNMGNALRFETGQDQLAHPNTPPKPPPPPAGAPGVTPVPDVTPKMGMYYEFGKKAALSAYAI